MSIMEKVWDRVGWHFFIDGHRRDCKCWEEGHLKKHKGRWFEVYFGVKEIDDYDPVIKKKEGEGK